jgi:hypothetical protein
MARVIAAAALLVLGGCPSDYQVQQDLPQYPDANPQDLPSLEWTDRLVQLDVPQVDVLFTIDNSSSMANEQRALIDNFPAFADFFVGSGLDYHIGVVSTDIERPAQDGHLHGARGHLYIDEETEDPVGVFGEMASMGTAGSGNESGLGAVYAALETRRDENGGFYRDDAALHTVIISDEEDQTPATRVTAEEFALWYAGLKPVDDRTFSSIVSFVDAPPADRGQRYLSVTQYVGGIAWDITDEDWSEVLEELGVQASGVRNEFFLSHRPVPDSITVHEETPDGVTLVHAEDVWTYDSARNSVRFVEYVPAPLSTVILHYTLLSSE